MSLLSSHLKVSLSLFSQRIAFSHRIAYFQSLMPSVLVPSSSPLTLSTSWSHLERLLLDVEQKLVRGWSKLRSDRRSTCDWSTFPGDHRKTWHEPVWTKSVSMHMGTFWKSLTGKISQYVQEKKERLIYIQPRETFAEIILSQDKFAEKAGDGLKYFIEFRGQGYSFRLFSSQFISAFQMCFHEWHTGFNQLHWATKTDIIFFSFFVAQRSDVRIWFHRKMLGWRGTTTRQWSDVIPVNRLGNSDARINNGSESWGTAHWVSLSNYLFE